MQCDTIYCQNMKMQCQLRKFRAIEHAQQFKGLQQKI